MPSGSASKKSLFAKEQDRPDVARRREQWRKYQGRIDPTRLVFIDETWTKDNMAPLRGWSPRGARLRATAPFGRWKTMTFIAALRCDRIDAPCLFDGPINGEAFLAYVKTFLVPARHPSGWSKAHLPAQVLPGPEPDRAGLRQAQTQPAKGTGPILRRPPQSHRPVARRLPARRVRQLPQKLRVFYIIPTRSRPRRPRADPSWKGLRQFPGRRSSWTDGSCRDRRSPGA